MWEINFIFALIIFTLFNSYRVGRTLFYCNTSYVWIKGLPEYVSGKQEKYLTYLETTFNRITPYRITTMLALITNVLMLVDFFPDHKLGEFTIFAAVCFNASVVVNLYNLTGIIPYVMTTNVEIKKYADSVELEKSKKEDDG